MSDPAQDIPPVAHRVALVALGACAAFALWALSDQWGQPQMPALLYLGVFVFVASYALVALALAGPVPVHRALIAALVPAIPVTLLALWAAQRYETASDFLDDPLSLSALAVLCVVAVPFVINKARGAVDWLDYAALFDAAWTTALRYALACVFVGVFWLLAFLSNTLLRLVDVYVIDDVMRTPWAVFAISGGVFGLGQAVVFELRDTISPYLILRLMRLLVPAVLVVVGVFLIALPLRGLSQLFGEFSAATTLMGTAIAALTLVSTALDTTDAAGVRTKGLRIATRLLAGAVVLLAGLALWAVMLRVQQYGWTPLRVFAASSAAILMAYGLGYVQAILRGRGWGARIRQVNVWMALCVMGTAILWLTPALNGYRIASASQVERYMREGGALEQVPIWHMANRWGIAGDKALKKLQENARPSDVEALDLRVSAAYEEPNRYRYRRAIEAKKRPSRVDRLLSILPVLPEGRAIPQDAFAKVSGFRLNDWADGCEVELPDGQPGCVLIWADLSPGEDPQASLFYRDRGEQVLVSHLTLRNGRFDNTILQLFDSAQGMWPGLTVEDLRQLAQGQYSVQPSGQKALIIGDKALTPAR